MSEITVKLYEVKLFKPATGAQLSDLQRKENCLTAFFAHNKCKRMVADSPRRHVSEVAKVFGADPFWARDLLPAFGVEIDEHDCYDVRQARQALRRAAVALSRPSRVVGEALMSQVEMGSDRDSCIRWIQARFDEAGPKVIEAGVRRPLTLEREDGARMKVQPYIAFNLKRNGQVGFAVSHLRNKEVPWIVLISRPWGRAFLRRRDEILRTVQSEKSRSRGVSFVTVSAGGIAKDEFSYRIGELVDSDKFWTQPTDGQRRVSPSSEEAGHLCAAAVLDISMAEYEALRSVEGDE